MVNIDRGIYLDPERLILLFAIFTKVATNAITTPVIVFFEVKEIKIAVNTVTR